MAVRRKEQWVRVKYEGPFSIANFCTARYRQLFLIDIGGVLWVEKEIAIETGCVFSIAVVGHGVPFLVAVAGGPCSLRVTTSMK
jgi:hypothetical protein